MRTSILGIVGSVALATLCCQRAEAQQVQVSQANRSIAITTTESAEHRADVATLHIGYKVYAADSASVNAEASRISNAVAAALDKLGVLKDAISSENQSTGVSQEYQNGSIPAEERAQHKFAALQSWSVKTTPDAVSKVLAVAVAAGANESGQIDWSLVDEEALTGQAEVKALAQAREQAAQMAGGMGAKLGNLLYASNQVESIRPMVPLHGRVFDRLEQFSALTPPPQLNLSAPMIMRTATVSAIFSVE